MQRWVPALEWLKEYRKDWLTRDMFAGLTVAVILIPQSMAYAALAGLPPIYGLYASILPPLLYILFGSSRQLSVGPVAISSILVLAGLSGMAQPGSEEFIGLAILTAFTVGIMQLALGVFRLGFLVNFLSHPIMMGFTSAAALIIMFSQLKSLLGVNIARSIHIHEVFLSAADNIGKTHLPTLLIGLGGIVVILLLRRVRRTFPGALVAVIIATVIVHIGNFDGVRTVGSVPEGLPNFAMPAWDWDTVTRLLGLSLMLTFVGLIESFAIARAIASRRKDHAIDANQELIALGISKIGGAFFHAYPTTGSFSRSAVNDEAGARSGLSSVFMVILVTLTVLFLTPLFSSMPYAVLSSIIIVAVAGLIKYREALILNKSHPWDFLLMLITFVATLLMGIIVGVVAGVLLSLGLMIYRSSTPHVCELGLLPGSVHYRNIERYPNALVNEKILIARFDRELYFGNANYFLRSMMKLVKAKGNKLELVVLDARSITDIDASGEQVFRELLEYLHENKVRFYLAGAIGPLRDRLSKTGLMQLIGESRQFMLVNDAVEFYHDDLGHDESGSWSAHALQTNHPQ